MAFDRRQAFSVMNSGSFSIEFCTLDLKEGTGGKKEFYPIATLGRQERTGTNTVAENTTRKSKAPNHRENITINVNLPGGQIRKVHVPLILKINSEPVL